VKTVDGLFAFEDELRRSGRCRLRIYEIHERTVVIATDLNRGPSVTNAAEALATQVAQQFGLDRARLLWIEHYPRTDSRPQPGTPGGEEYDLVTFEWDAVREHFHNPTWAYSHGAAVEALSARPWKRRIPTSSLDSVRSGTRYRGTS
jgi:hypothetical protein